MTEALVDLLGRTSFDAAGSHRNYNRLLLWDYGSEVSLFVDQDVDGVDHGWVARNIAQIMAIFGPEASIRLKLTKSPLDADIVIVSAKNKSRLQSEYFYQFLNKRFKIDRNHFNHIKSEINQLYSDSSYAWFWPEITHDPEMKEKKINGFLAIIEPEIESFKRSFNKMIFLALGYGNGSYLSSKIKSVQAHGKYETGKIEGVDFSILYFLYNSQARNGMKMTSALKLFRGWMTSDEFTKLNIRFIKY